jgi:hypothetical protein
VSIEQIALGFGILLVAIASFWLGFLRGRAAVIEAILAIADLPTKKV